MKRAAGATKKRVAKKPKNIVPDEPVDPATIIKTIYLGSDNGSKLRDQFKANKPFSHIQLKEFMDAEFLDKVQTDLEAEKWYPKVNDLYTFMQTNDLKKMKRVNVNKLRKALYSQEFRNFLEGITGIKLNDTIDMSAAVYSKGNQLLCHDDELEGRRIAYILYLVPEDWNQEDGGTLDLYNLDKNSQPADIVKSIVPVRNSFVFFEVTPDSHHQVSEVFSDKDRLSISGWFHGENIVRPPPYYEPVLNKIKFEKNESLKLEEWINPDYFKPEMRVKINKTFARNNSINLHNFFVADKFEAMEKVLETELPWKTIGPANRRQYDSLGRDQDNEPAILGEVKKLMRSQEFGSFLKDITGLTLESTFNELRRFVPRKGHYTLAQDYVEKDRALDFFYSFTDLEEEWGGFVTYMSEEEELLTIVPTKNSLSLVYRDELCMRFVKFITCEATRPRIDFAGMYWEDPSTMNEEDFDDEENGEEDEDDDEDMEDDGIEWVEEEDDENENMEENGDAENNTNERD